MGPETGPRDGSKRWVHGMVPKGGSKGWVQNIGPRDGPRGESRHASWGQIQREDPGEKQGATPKGITALDIQFGKPNSRYRAKL